MIHYKNFLLSAEDDHKITQIFSELKIRYQNYKDPWGFNLDICEKTLRKIVPFYRSYFKVRFFGAENIFDHPYVVTSNHTGQIPLDAILITVAFIMETNSPRVLRAMVERFMAQLPFIGDFAAQTGSILGDRQNCSFLIDHGESILVFPEGARGISKNSIDFYQLRHFSEGFYRIALQKKTPILPVCVVGAEEMYPLVFHSRKLARYLRLPALPLSLNLVPLPSPIDIYVGPEISTSHLVTEPSDKEIKENIYHIENTIKKMIRYGLAHRRPFIDFVRKPLSQFIVKELRSKDQA